MAESPPATRNEVPIAPRRTHQRSGDDEHDERYRDCDRGDRSRAPLLSDRRQIGDHAFLEHLDCTEPRPRHSGSQLWGDRFDRPEEHLTVGLQINDDRPGFPADHPLMEILRNEHQHVLKLWCSEKSGEHAHEQIVDDDQDLNLFDESIHDDRSDRIARRRLVEDDHGRLYESIVVEYLGVHPPRSVRREQRYGEYHHREEDERSTHRGRVRSRRHGTGCREKVSAIGYRRKRVHGPSFFHLESPSP